MEPTNATESNGAPATTQAVQPSGSDTSAAATNPLNVSTQAPAAGAPNVEPEKDWKAEYSKVDSELKKINQSYAEARKLIAAQGAEKNDYRRRFEGIETTQKQLVEALEKVFNRSQYNPDEFMENLRTQGPDFLKSQVKAELEGLKTHFQKELHSRDSRIEELVVAGLVKDRRNDEKNYPNFADMEADMIELYNGQPDIYAQMSPDKRVDALYNQAVLRHSQDALLKAEKLGREKAETELAREAHASVPSGGKGGTQTPPNPNGMTAAQLRDAFDKAGLVDK